MRRGHLMECPACSKAMVRADHSHNGLVTLDRCAKCRGLWVELPALETIEAGVWSDLDALQVTTVEALSDLPCPQCGTRLVTVAPEDEPTLHIDRCPACHGIWLDNGEFAQFEKTLDEFAHKHGERLHDRPAGWSRFRWLAYQVFRTQAEVGAAWV